MGLLKNSPLNNFNTKVEELLILNNRIRDKFCRKLLDIQENLNKEAYSISREGREESGEQPKIIIEKYTINHKIPEI